jgi:hypothetical protein
MRPHTHSLFHFDAPAFYRAGASFIQRRLAQAAGGILYRWISPQPTEPVVGGVKVSG